MTRKYVHRERPVYRLEILPGATYSDEETEFILAVDRFKREHRRPYPAWSEILGVLRSLGWRKVPLPAPPEAPADDAPR